MRLYFARPRESLKSSYTVPLVTDDQGPRTVKNQLIACHRDTVFRWTVFTSAEIAMSFYPGLARSYSPSVRRE